MHVLRSKSPCHLESASSAGNLIKQLGIGLLLNVALSSGAIAQTYPTQTVRLIVPYASGGAMDVIARPLAQGLGELLGQSVVVDNRPGANTIVGTEQAVRAKPDGHTLLLATSSTLSVNPAAYKKLPYDVMRDFDPIAKLGYSYHILFSRSGFAPSTIAATVAQAKANPGSVSFGTTGVGSSPHFAMLLIESAAGVKFLHVPFKGSSEILTAVLGNQVDVSAVGPSTLLSLIKQGRIKALAATAVKRSPIYPDLPTMIEQGFPGFTTGAWYCIVTRSGTPVAIINRLNREINRVLQQPGVRAPLEADGVTVEGNQTPAELGKYIGDEMRKWATIIKDANIQME